MSIAVAAAPRATARLPGAPRPSTSSAKSDLSGGPPSDELSPEEEELGDEDTEEEDESEYEDGQLRVMRRRRWRGCLKPKRARLIFRVVLLQSRRT